MQLIIYLIIAEAILLTLTWIVLIAYAIRRRNTAVDGRQRGTPPDWGE